MKNSNDDRKKSFIDTLMRTGSMKIALEVTSKKYNVSKSALRMDWQRRAVWPKEIFEGLTDPNLTFLYILEIRKALQQNEEIIRKSQVLNCKLGAVRTKIDTYFKLVNLQRSIHSDKTFERLEILEKKVDELLETKRENLEAGE